MSSDALVGPTVEVTGMTMVETNPRTHMGSRSCTGKKCMNALLSQVYVLSC
jgi:hypothetical protein